MKLRFGILRLDKMLLILKAIKVIFIQSKHLQMGHLLYQWEQIKLSKFGMLDARNVLIKWTAQISQK